CTRYLYRHRVVRARLAVVRKLEVRRRRLPVAQPGATALEDIEAGGRWLRTDPVAAAGCGSEGREVEPVLRPVDLKLVGKRRRLAVEQQALRHSPLGPAVDRHYRTCRGRLHTAAGHIRGQPRGRGGGRGRRGRGGRRARCWRLSRGRAG